MRRHRHIMFCVLSVAAVFSSPLFAQPARLGLGHTPTHDELAAWDIAIGPDGKELPPGSGVASRGKAVYERRCVVCHGATAREGPQDILVGGRGTLAGPKPIKTIGSYWPYATTLWDYLNRAMPFDRPGTLSADEVYATTAYLLFLNGIIGEHDVMDARTLPQVKMPNRDGFVPDARPDTTVTPGPGFKVQSSKVRQSQAPK